MNDKDTRSKAERYPTVDGRIINNDSEYAEYIKERMTHSETVYAIRYNKQEEFFGFEAYLINPVQVVMI